MLRRCSTEVNVPHVTYKTDSSLTGSIDEERPVVGVDIGSDVSDVLVPITLTEMSPEIAVMFSVGR